MLWPVPYWPANHWLAASSSGVTERASEPYRNGPGNRYDASRPAAVPPTSVRASAVTSAVRQPARDHWRARWPAQLTSQMAAGPPSRHRPIQVKAHDRRAPSAPAGERMKMVDGKYTTPRAANAKTSDRRRPGGSRPSRTRALIMSRPPTTSARANTGTR